MGHQGPDTRHKTLGNEGHFGKRHQALGGASGAGPTLSVAGPILSATSPTLSGHSPQFKCINVKFELALPMTIQSANRLQKAPTDYTKPPKDYTKPLNIKQNREILNKDLKYQTRVATNMDLT